LNDVEKPGLGDWIVRSRAYSGNEMAESNAPKVEQKLTAVVADDDRLTALSLADSLGRHGITPLAVVHTAGEAITKTQELKPDVLVVDLDFGPGPTGLDVAVAVRLQLPKIGIAIVTAYEDPRLLAPNLPATPIGAVYVIKHQVDNPKQVADAARDSFRYSKAVGRIPQPKNRINLTDSQVELLRLVSMGLSNHAISQELFITPSAVEKAITRLATKLSVDRSQEANLRVGLTHRYLDHVGYTRG
jgi:DNA-binding NarL/FixJ family response regulator